MNIVGPTRLVLLRAGKYDYGDGRVIQDPNYMIFSQRGCNYPQDKYAIWWLTQFRRWGLLQTAPDYQAVAQRINRIDLWKEAAQAVGGITAPTQVMRSSTLIDGKVWTGADPEGYARGFAIQHKGA